MTALKRIALTLLVLPLLFNAGFDVAHDVKARKVASFVEKHIRPIQGVAQVTTHRCYDIKDNFWLCDVEVTLTTGENDRRLLPVPYEAVEK